MQVRRVGQSSPYTDSPNCKGGKLKTSYGLGQSSKASISELSSTKEYKPGKRKNEKEF
jgi:hypothetical protein